jgi:hypothetical protein
MVVRFGLIPGVYDRGRCGCRRVGPTFWCGDGRIRIHGALAPFPRSGGPPECKIRRNRPLCHASTNCSPSSSLRLGGFLLAVLISQIWNIAARVCYRKFGIFNLPTICRFSYYGDRSGSGDVREVYDDGSGQLRGRFLSRLKILASLRRSEWHEGYFKNLNGPGDGLSEIRFKADGVQQRPLGFHISDSEFVILFWAEERGGKFVPRTACEISLRRKEEIIAGKSQRHVLWLALE